MGMLPNSQFGDVAVVDVPGAASAPLVVSGTSQPVRVGLALQGSSSQNFITSTGQLTPNSDLSVSARINCVYCELRCSSSSIAFSLAFCQCTFLWSINSVNSNTKLLL